MIYLALLKQHWGKAVAGVLLLMWVGVTVGLYNGNQDLHEQLGKTQGIVETCIADRTNMDNELVLLKADIARIQADNAEYKATIAVAEITIQELETSIPATVDSIEKEVLPESCEGVMTWMLDRAVDK